MGITLKPGDVTFSFGPSAVGLSETRIQLLVGMERSSSSSGSGHRGEHLRRWGQLFSLEGKSRLRKPHQSCLKPETQRCTDRHMLTARFRSIKHPLQQGRMGSAQDAEPPTTGEQGKAVQAKESPCDQFNQKARKRFGRLDEPGH